MESIRGTVRMAATKRKQVLGKRERGETANAVTTLTRTIHRIYGGHDFTIRTPHHAERKRVPEVRSNRDV